MTAHSHAVSVVGSHSVALGLLSRVTTGSPDRLSLSNLATQPYWSRTRSLDRNPRLVLGGHSGSFLPQRHDTVSSPTLRSTHSAPRYLLSIVRARCLLVETPTHPLEREGIEHPLLRGDVASLHSNIVTSHDKHSRRFHSNTPTRTRRRRLRSRGRRRRRVKR